VRPVLFVSDLHLSPERPAIVERFFRFLEEEARAAAALYILGDLLEHWIGDDDANESFNRDALPASPAVASRCPSCTATGTSCSAARPPRAPG
jgi:UDP-2,3-diacylglucosamine hydrolase